MQQLSRILSRATAAIGSSYFRLPIRVGEHLEYIYRERIYCYELYHQMRIRWPQNCPYCLNGELDKRGHPQFTELGKIPDLLVHSPGSMQHNHAIIEVKPANFDNRGLSKDLDTLLRFKAEAQYERSILLIYGEGLDRDDIVERIRTASLDAHGKESD